MITTERLILRHFEPTATDYQALYDIMADATVNRFLPWWPWTDLQQAQSYYQDELQPTYASAHGQFWAVCLKTDNRPIGYVDVSADASYDFGYGLAQAYWNQGLITEASQAALTWLQQHDYPYVTATHDVNNGASGQVMRKLGMHYQYSYREQWQPKDKLVTFRLYQLDLDGQVRPRYAKYWERYADHFVEEI